VQVDLPDALERADEEGIGREQMTWCRALDMAFAEARIALFEKGRLLSA